MTPLLLSLLSCSGSKTEADPAECGPDTESEEWCPIDECALGCTSIKEGTACCLDAYGMGNFDEENLELLARGCTGDYCDQEQYISPAAAMCIAQVNGLGSGLGWCGSVIWAYGEDSYWSSYSLIENRCEGEEEGALADIIYWAVDVDAFTGGDVSWGKIYALAECPGE